MTLAIKVLIFTIVTLALFYISRRSLINPRSHGFYRFFAWEAILVLILMNFRYWFENPVTPRQLISWTLLLISLYLIVRGLYNLLAMGKPSKRRPDNTLFDLEKTTVLTRTGPFKYIRHPIYSSLLFLTWGTYLKSPSGPGVALALVATGLLIATAKVEERENIRFFGDQYRDYMRETKNFIPFIF